MQDRSFDEPERISNDMRYFDRNLEEAQPALCVV